MSNEVMTIDANNMLMNAQVMSAMSALAETMSQGTIMTPDHLRGKPADCMAVIMQAARWKMDPFVVASKTFPIKGRLGYESQLIVAAMQSTGAVKSRFHYEYGGSWPNGADAWVRCGAVLAGESEIQWGEPIYIAKVSVKNSPLWRDDPKQQGAYLAAKRWSRLFAPGAVLGVYSIDELEQSPERDVTPQQAPQVTGNDAIDMVLNDEPEKAIENTFSELSDLIDDLDDITMVKGMSGDIRADYEAGKVDADQSNELLSKLSVKRDELKAAAINSFDFNE